MYRSVENALHERQVRAVPGQIDRVEPERLKMAIKYFVDSLNDGILLFGVCQCEIVGSACTIQEFLDEIVGEVRLGFGSRNAQNAAGGNRVLAPI